jgi:NADH-ubiquinone oxidoreductase chain 5
MIIGVGTNFWGNALFVLPENLIIFDAEFLPVYIKLIPVIFSFLGFLLAYLFYVVLSPRFLYSLKQKSLVIFFYNFFNRKWFFDKVYNEFINQIVLNLGYYKTYKLLDRGVIEKLGPFGLMNFFYNNALKINFLQTGLIYHSALVMLIGIISLFMVVGFFSFFSVFFNIYLINIFIVLIFFIVYIDNKYNIKL